MTCAGLQPALTREPGAVGVRPESLVSIVETDGFFRLVSAVAIGRGITVLRMDGGITDQPSRYSVQIGRNLHLRPISGSPQEGAIDPHPWRFMNHSCEPNVYVRDLEVIALRNLHGGEDILFDYHTTEYELAEPFDCLCGASQCRGTIRGFRHLDDVERRKLAPYLAPHLSEYLDPARVMAPVEARR